MGPGELHFFRIFRERGNSSLPSDILRPGVHAMIAARSATPVAKKFFRRLWRSSSPSMCEQNSANCPVDALRRSLARESELLRRQEALLQEQELLRQESDHRILNGLQVVASLLRLQGQAAGDPNVAAQLSTAANRVATIERIHRRLHSRDGRATVELGSYLNDICHDFANLSTSRNAIVLNVMLGGEGIEISGTTAVSLGFIVTELLTNAVKHGNGPIVVSLDSDPVKGYALSVSNDGPLLPDGFDPAKYTGLGMKLIGGLVQRIRGEFGFGPGRNNQGARFVVLFP